MKKRSISYNENKITEILGSTGYIFPRNQVELERFEILFGDDDFGLTGKEISPDIILNRNKKESRIRKLSEARDFMRDDLKLVARKDEESFNAEIDKIFKQSNDKKNQNEE